MALRLYKCPSCGKETQDIYYGKYPKTVSCICGGKAEHKWTAPAAIFMDFRSGYDIGLNRYFNTRRELNNYLVAHNMSETKSTSGHEKRIVPEDKTHKVAYLAERERKLKRG